MISNKNSDEVVASAVLSRNELLYVDVREPTELRIFDCGMRIENHVLSKFRWRRLTSIARSPQRFGFALASLRKQRTASAAPHSGDNSAVAPPVPIPNTEVKRCSPDGSTATGRARVGRRQN